MKGLLNAKVFNEPFFVERIIKLLIRTSNLRDGTPVFNKNSIFDYLIPSIKMKIVKTIQLITALFFSMTVFAR